MKEPLKSTCESKRVIGWRDVPLLALVVALVSGATATGVYYLLSGRLLAPMRLGIIVIVCVVVVLCVVLGCGRRACSGRES